MTFEEAKAKWPEAAVREDWSMDLKTLKARRLVIPASAPGESATTVWEDESL